MVDEKNREKFIFIIFFFVLSCVILPSSPSIAEDMGGEQECFAIGTGSILKGNLAQAKKNAIRMALSKGVEDYLVRLLGRQTVATHFESLAHNIIPNADQEIENFHILAEQQAGTRYNVFVKMKVNENGISEKLREAGIFQATHQAVKVLFMVAESRGAVDVFWWRDTAARTALMPIELALHGVFQDRGFNPINRIMDLPASDYPVGAFSANLRPEDALIWGEFFSAEVVVYGKSLILDHKLTLNLKALDVQRSIQICEKSGSQKISQGVADGEQILGIMRKCVNRLAAELCSCILRNINAKPQETRQLDITLSGISQPRQFQIFTNFLKTRISGVKSVVPSKVSEESMSATVDFQGDRISFITLVLNHQGLPFPLHLGQTGTETILFYLE